MTQLYRLNLGTVVRTSSVASRLAAEDTKALLDKHRQCDWGSLNDEDAGAQNEMIAAGQRGQYMGVHRVTLHSPSETRDVWVITDPDNAKTTILLPEEY